MNVWIKVSDVKRLRKLALIGDETNASIVTRVLNAVENNRDDLK